MRIVSLSPSNTELLGFMGLDRFIVGVDKYTDWPASVNGLPRLGSDLNIDMEAVEALRPDLVLASLTVPGMEKNIAGLQERNLPFITLNPKRLSDISDCMIEVGEAMGELERARAAKAKYEDMLAHYAELSRRCTDKPSLYWEWWPKPVFSPGGGNWLSEISALAGAVNVFADNPAAKVKTDWDDVAGRDPDYILLAWVGVREQLVKPESIRTRPGSERLRAVAEDRVRVMEESLYCRPSPLLVAGLRKLGHMLHPDVYPPYDAEEAERWLNGLL
ncbi:cobalamin-binding protein [Paenibacillus hemerocallicola]|uniref:Cobalamin-binding protein n=1 Tax=Paenibacillus hemerocallicola TaxID=1172614 RepID=A0A5C4T6D5_9BACL|nr:cobalamin-binding protein [Paenibacillus hemerocallicola]TNJ64200.1 cobalamin-binding protein [Paenibacillus hemerocallicola]